MAIEHHGGPRIPPDLQTNLEAALIYASRGWPVLPLHTPRGSGCSCRGPECTHPGKHPRTEHGLRDATTDETMVRGWWRRWPRANVGVATGSASGLVVLDVDPRHEGDAGLAGLERQHGELPHTIESITGGGGRHIYFAHPSTHVPSRTVATGIDVKADGGYVVAPPSLHVSGQRYEWEISSPPDDAQPAPLPEWVLAKLLSPSGEPERVSPAEVAVIRDGKRNVTLASLAGSMRRVGMQPEEIAAGLLEVNRRRCHPRLPESEVAKIAKGMRRYAPASTLGAGSSPSSSLYSPGDSDDSGRAPVELRAVAKPGPRRWTVDGLLPARLLTVLYGDGGMAKSYLAMLLGEHVARGEDLFGRCVEQGCTLYLDWELDQEEQVRRAYAVAAGLGRTSPAQGLYYREMGVPLGEALPDIRQWVQDLQVSLAILDSFGLATLGDATAAKDVVPLLWAVSRLPCTSLFIDHVRNPQPGERSDEMNPFGSAYKRHVGRSIIHATRVGGDGQSLRILLRQRKSNFSALSEPLGVRVTFEDECVGFAEESLTSPAFARVVDRQPAVEKVYQALVAAARATPEELAGPTGLKAGTVKNQLTELHRKGRATPLGGGVWEPVVIASSPSPPLYGDDDASHVPPPRSEGTTEEQAHD